MGYQRECTICEFLIQHGQRIIQDIPQERFNQPAAGEGNPPVWIVAHLTMAADFVLQLLGRPGVAPAGWRERFGPGSPPPKAGEAMPTKAEALAAFEKGYRAAIEAARTADPAALTAPHPIPFMKGTPIETQAELLSHLLTSHLAAHLGQLSYCRRIMGFGPIF